MGWARTIIQFFWLQCPCVTICQWASASSVCIWPPCIVVGCCDAQQIKYHWHYIGFGTNRQLRTSAGEVRYGNLHLCRTLCWSALLCWTQWSEHPMHLSRERADASPAVLIHCVTQEQHVCVCVCDTLKLRWAQNYYSDNIWPALMWQTYILGMIPRICSRCWSVCHGETITAEPSLGIREPPVTGP